MPNVQTGTDAMSLLVHPSLNEIKEAFPPHLVAKILRPLDPDTGSVERGEPQCVGIEAVVYNPFALEVFYKVKRPDGKFATQFMRFWPNTATMRCLPVTRGTDNFGPRVVMQHEFRRQRGKWVQMLCAGGDKKGKALDVILSELVDETGCCPTSGSRVLRIDQAFMDDGLHAEPLDLLTIDHLEAPDSHVYTKEYVKGITLVPWIEWKAKALRGEYDDIYCLLFAARCDLDRDGKIVVNGKQEVLR